MSTSAGRVLIIPKGDYNAATTYAMLDMVYYNGSSYVCKQPSTGNLPTNTTYWQIMTGDISGKMDKANPTGTGSFSLNRKASTTVGTNSFAEGNNCTASGSYSHAEGDGTVASEMYSHAEGTSTTASAMAAHAEGESTSATGSYSHAENSMTRATGYASHSEGDHTLASGDQSHAEGFYTQAGYDNQHVSGIYNDNKATTLFEVGNGESSFNRSNAFEVYSDGSISTDNGTTKVKLENLVSQSQALTNYVTETGVKNVLSIGSIKALNYTGTWSGNTYTKNGITTTVNSDGTLSFNGTASDDVSITLAEDITVDKDEIISGCPAGGATAKYFLAFEKKTTPWTRYATDLGEGATITTRTSADNVVYFRVRSGQTVSNLLVSPMIRDASIADDSYQPYAKTNVELTQDVAGIEGLLANAIGKEITAATAWSDLENMGTYVMNGVPFTGNWSIVLVLKRNENTGVQIAFRVGNASDVSSSYVAYRMYYTGTWSNWAAVNATNMT